ncbi:MAG: hypothetical protein V3V96_13960 [Acidiferrobacterales bacterium]
MSVFTEKDSVSPVNRVESLAAYKTRCKMLQEISQKQLKYSLCGIALGFICILGGIHLFMNGIYGSTSWTTKVLGSESYISDAAPGAILFFAGLFIILITRFTIKIER